MDKFFNSIKCHKAWLLLNFPLFIMSLLLFVETSYWKVLTPWTGYFSIAILCTLLFLNPLRHLFPTSKVLREFNKYRRPLGVASFNYAALHVICYMIKRGGFFEMLKWLLHPIILPGLLAFLIFIPLALSSNKVSLKYLKFPKWKKLHTKVYIAQWGTFFHLLILYSLTRQTKALVCGLLLSMPLFAVQYIRRQHRKKAEHMKGLKGEAVKTAA
ncbi:MAG: hypothetical protein GW748_03800 [Alphaproteobacteria bacterium]|nr:hypothetical protein [Alphaproteobacteria bacterium]NCQ66848.1 hypothetical protein [Alphaproteobacteria bacterium]NCT07416.1 hypothetical protein [Alphaproteobacteria bacterium]